MLQLQYFIALAGWPVWPRLDSGTRRHTWVEFAVGSLLAPRGFSPGTPVFLSLQLKKKTTTTTFLNSNSIQNSVPKVCQSQVCYVLPLLINVQKRSLSDKSERKECRKFIYSLIYNSDVYHDILFWSAGAL